MNYGIYINNQITAYIYIYFHLFPKFRKMLAFMVYFVHSIFILNTVFGFCVFNSIYEHSFKFVFDIFSKTKSKNVPEV